MFSALLAGVVIAAAALLLGAAVMGAIALINDPRIPLDLSRAGLQQLLAHQPAFGMIFQDARAADDQRGIERLWGDLRHQLACNVPASSVDSDH